MKSRFAKILTAFFLAIFIAGFAVSAEATINEQINYQGKLTTSGGVAVTNGQYCMKFVIYDTACTGTPCSGTALWTEVWNASSNKVDIASGLFSVMLGSQTTFSSAGLEFNSNSLYLEVSVDSACSGAYETLYPRKQLGTVPSAFTANKLDGYTWAVPGAIGSTTPNTGKFTTLSASNTFTTSNGSILSSASGVLTLGGVSGTNNENLTFDFESTADKVKIDSATGAATIDFNALNITTSGIVTAGNQLKVLEGGSTPTKYTIFQGGDQSADVTYVLPASNADGYLKNTSGTLSWDSMDLTGYVKKGTGSANQVAYWTDSDTIAGENQLATSRGGTGLGSFTQYGILYASTASVLSQLGLGTSTQVLHGNASGAASWGSVVEADLSLTNNTTGNVSITAHGFVPIAPNNTTQFLRGDATWATPPGVGVYQGLTGSNYTGSLTYSGGYSGYDAGDKICNAAYSGSHLCSVYEITYSNSAATLPTSGTAWVSSGAPKYAPADLPVNDCNGFTYGTAGTYLGNFWMFDANGGIGGCGHCANSLPLACCK